MGTPSHKVGLDIMTGCAGMGLTVTVNAQVSAHPYSFIRIRLNTVVDEILVGNIMPVINCELKFQFHHSEVYPGKWFTLLSVTLPGPQSLDDGEAATNALGLVTAFTSALLLVHLHPFGPVMTT